MSTAPGAAPGLLERFRMDGKTVVITGASSGLGAGFARAFADAGADLVLGARRAGELEAIADEIRTSGRTVVARVTDVTDPDACTALVQAGIDTLGRVDVLINNAGVGTAVPAVREEPDEFRRVLEVNLMGSYWMAQACARVMEPGSSIVNVASVLGLVKSYSPQAAYSASKAAVIGLTRDLSQQWSLRKGIRVNAVAPGYFASEMTAGAHAERLGEFVRSTATLQRFGEQHELDAAVLFLASDAASYVTGATLAVDGGMSGH
ncbi:2-deoxy-D-gluconate 3-dehydrogenase [Nocardioides phosphati]|uniref:2-deoxy-D-gluconate 3-dehydrogenase n=1 Tax=Nocardioides phosphati TaxID=1867775 RepID=A0ABQ2NDL8_9ACTN|nr:SDR family oxidoreductase [Nocardioides phosphati]GGO93979.1 2-deoxy-D-gluconate 3-dehydrogenase [Nocardioides phosphati]